MATVSGVNFKAWQGEDLDMQFNVENLVGVAYSLTGGAATLTYRKPDGTDVDVTGVISDTTVTVSLPHATTQELLGKHKYQLMCRNAAGKIVMSVEGTIVVAVSLNPDAVAL